MSHCINNSNKNSEQNDCVTPEYLKILDDNLRYTFMGIFIVISIASVMGNIAAIYSIVKRKCRYIQKTCIISLAISDLFSTVVIATNNLETFSHPLIIWTLGPFFCSFIPMCQMVGILASSVALMFIAMDRYRNVVHALSKRWNPKPPICLLATVILWSISFGVSYPLYDFFIEGDVTIIYMRNNSGNLTIEMENASLCITFQKQSMMVYYIIMVIIIFLPLLVIFIWFYYNIATLVWKHRKPLSTIFNKKAGIENSSSNSKTLEIGDKKTKATNYDHIRVERKIRTFKIILVLMIVFIICRFPYFTIYILKLSLEMDEYGTWTWILNYCFTALHIINCCLNPLLYTFLNQTLTIWIKIKRNIKTFTWEICCFCFSNAEFEDFERENPFVVNNNNSQVKDRTNDMKY